jgi:hypothetical protein
MDALLSTEKRLKSSMRETQLTASGEMLVLNTFVNPLVFSLPRIALLDIKPEVLRKLSSLN